jgi:hypothetical protein
MGNWKKTREHTSASSKIRGALTLGAFGGGKTYTFENEDTGETRTITAGGHLEDGYSLTDQQLGRKIENGEFD